MGRSSALLGMIYFSQCKEWYLLLVRLNRANYFIVNLARSFRSKLVLNSMPFKCDLQLENQA